MDRQEEQERIAQEQQELEEEAQIVHSEEERVLGMSLSQTDESEAETVATNT
eukprot:CAMPEP_0205813598 /NCGR_PEP_ID=MMETSP0205-20121125/18303_1 /ASSEMBLY_ACC=CAM_ASM_000278 /TAXON_ID=36767 /ORGANISM="Euplotes focardii, Strain TN1" /LENGTH=51 /DNA_ID=CAMNT_0053095939 /DNA_START=85 /DNA_END=237 /DNA_ORIENTATION=+